VSTAENLVPKPRREKLVLFVAGRSPNSAVALLNLRKMFGRNAGPDIAFEVVDVIEQPERAMASRVFVTPTLLFEDRHLHQRLIGDLSSADDLSAFLESGRD
jgi:hypothetical protein